MSEDRVSLGSRIRAARDPGSTPAARTPPASPGGTRPPDPIVRMSSLRQRPTPSSRAATSAEFHNDNSVWVSTPVRASQRTEFAEKLDYAFAYGEELAKLLRAHGFKTNIGLTLDTEDSESDFAVLLANMTHVFGPISRDEVLKLLDLDFEYDEYHLTLNELIFGVLPTVLRGTALVLFEESAHVHPHDGRCALQRLRFHVEGIGDPDTNRFWVRLRSTVIDETVEPAPQLAVFSTLADKHRKLHPDYGDYNRVEDLHSVLRASAAHSPYVTPLYLVVIRDLNANHRLTFAALALRLGRVFRDESPFARLTVTPPPAASGGGGRTGGGRPAVASINAFNKARRVPPVGDWKPQQGGGRYLIWEGTGMPCVTCWRLWAATTGHTDSDGVCPYSCTAAFAPGRAPSLAPNPPAAPPPLSAWPPAAAPAPRAHSLQEIGPPPNQGPVQGASATAVQFGTASMPPAPLDPTPPAPLSGGDNHPPASFSLRQLDEEEDWPALRESPIWIPASPAVRAALDRQSENLQASGGAPSRE